MNEITTKGQNALLDDFKAAKGLTSDAAIARAMKVTPQTVAQWRSGQVTMTDERITQMALIAELDAPTWLIMSRILHAKDKETQRAWSRALGAVSYVATHVVATACLALMLVTPARTENLNNWLTRHYAK